MIVNEAPGAGTRVNPERLFRLVSEVYLAGERENRTRGLNSRTGIPLNQTLLNDPNRVTSELGLDVESVSRLTV